MFYTAYTVSLVRKVWSVFSVYPVYPPLEHRSGGFLRGRFIDPLSALDLFHEKTCTLLGYVVLPFIV